jgi:CzcA family heavy metal efflux pump
MWIVQLALRRPITVAVMAALMMLLGLISLNSMNFDIFPAIDVPMVNLVWYYPGLSAEEMEQRVVNITERAGANTVNGVDHIESTSLNGIGLVKFYFQEGTDLGLALSQIAAVTTAIKNFLPPGISPPTVLDYNATEVPIASLVISGDQVTDRDLYDFGFNFANIFLFTIPGLASPAPFGGASRQVMVNIDPTRLYAKGLSPADIVNAVQAANVIVPGGTAKIGDTEYNVVLNGSPLQVSQFNRLPIKVVNGAPVHFGDIGSVSDSEAVPTDVVTVNGKIATYRLILKHPAASTISVIDAVKQQAIPLMSAIAPKGMKLELAFDQSLFVRAALFDVLQEGVLAAALVGIMVLIFLGSWRSTLIVITSIPLAILTAILGLKLSHQTINIMSLGGLALAVGMLVDDATVEVENIHRNHAMGKKLGVAILDAAKQIALPAFVGTLSICIVFAPVLSLTGVARYLFTPLALAVVYAMPTSYLLSRTLVPSMARHLLFEDPGADRIGGVFGRFASRFEHGFEGIIERYRTLLGLAMERRTLVLTCIGGMVLVSIFLVKVVGEDFFPNVDAGMIRLHARVPVGTRLERSTQIMARVERVIREVIPPRELHLVTDHIGLPIYWALLFYETDSLGPQDADIQIQLNPKHHPSENYIRRIRAAVTRKVPEVQIYSQPADIVSQVLNFGQSAPIDVQFAADDIHASYALARELKRSMETIPGAVDVRIPQVLDYPTLQVAVDRDKALELGITENNVASSMLSSLASSIEVSPSQWLDWGTGVNYSLAVQTPQHLVDSIQAISRTPITSGNQIGLVQSTDLQPLVGAQFLGNLSTVQHQLQAQGVNHYTIRRVVDVQCNVEGRDLGSVSTAVGRYVSQLKGVPRGTQIRILGEAQAMRESFTSLGEGLIFAIALVYLLMATNFQSWRDPMIIMLAIPGALAGVLWMLVITRTTLNVESLMGAIMAVGVGVANGNLLITFANDRTEKGKDPMSAAIEAGVTRMRPVIMTALAMILGMLPMALAMGEGGEQNAPLGRAVIGGLVAATFMTLFVVPIAYSLFGANQISKRQRDLEVAAFIAETEQD